MAGGETVSLRLVPITLREANAFIAAHHRHHQPVRGWLCGAAVADDERIRGVAVVERASARMLDHRTGDLHADFTAEVTRVCTDGAKNACSMLYAACWRAVRALGWLRLITYILPEEGGASLRAAGWVCLGEAGGGSWSRQSRPRIDTHPTQMKLVYAVAV